MPYETIPVAKARLTNGFFADLQKKLRDVTVNAVYDRFEESGRFAALSCVWREGMPKPHIFWDSDCAKWIEGASYLLMEKRDPALEAKIDALIERIGNAQLEDGYFNSYYIPMEIQNRFTLYTHHELYCLGHLIEAGVAYEEATGKDKLRIICEKYVALVDRVFRAEHSAAFDTPGHEEIELALYRLYRHTGDEKYMTLMRYFIDTRGTSARDTTYDFVAQTKYPKNGKPERRTAAYAQAHLPVRAQETAEGHAVRACYLYAAMADQAAEDGDEALLSACRTIFDNIFDKRMYVTGGVGSSHLGETFTLDYDLPDYEAYAETCAALALALFARRMLKSELRARYGDAAELALYSGALAGLSLSGDAFFYENPLAYSPERAFLRTRYAIAKDHCPIGQRVKLFDCSCCPPNVLRVYGSVQEWAFAEREGEICVHLYMGCAADTRYGKINMQTNYPYEGEAALTMPGGDYALSLRVPGWAKRFTAMVNGERAAAAIENGYVRIERIWAAGDRVDVSFDLPVRVLHANPRVQQEAGRVCVTKGPIVYCAESVDNGPNVRDLAVRAPFEEIEIPSLGVRGLRAKGSRSVAGDLPLYAERAYPREAADVILIPYYAWANRGEDEMTVWLMEDK